MAGNTKSFRPDYNEDSSELIRRIEVQAVLGVVRLAPVTSQELIWSSSREGRAGSC